MGLFDNEFNFVQFGMKPPSGSSNRPRIYARDNKGEVWLQIETDEWELVSQKTEGEPKRMKRGLTAGELVQYMEMNRQRRR